ncbi:hypothetical protein [Bacillus pumilus]|uniref:hypothetical protein n=1 Tax=Bacillus pumilus TaxID=1408 RepID=UPI0011A1CFE7|nr:hypothetical protein [Bacillus pumilus]
MGIEVFDDRGDWDEERHGLMKWGGFVDGDGDNKEKNGVRIVGCKRGSRYVFFDRFTLGS